MLLASWCAFLGALVPACIPMHNDCDELYDVRTACGLESHDAITLSADSGCEDCSACMIEQSCADLESGAAYVTCGCPTPRCSADRPCPSALTCDMLDGQSSGDCVAK
jgi:hypothetical protein